MVLNDIEKLIKKYENGETSLKEEQVLKQYFKEKDVAPHLEYYRPIFSYFLENKQVQHTNALLLKSKNTFNFKWLSVAAALAIVAGVYFIKPATAPQCKKEIVGTFCKPETAFMEVSKQLTIISNHFNKGAATVNYLNEINKGTATINYLNEIENSTRIVFKNN